jgi:hypothetical protein
MNAVSSVVLFPAGWQLPQVRPLPANVSLKKMPAPAHTSADTRRATTRGSCAQAASRSSAVKLNDLCPVTTRSSVSTMASEQPTQNSSTSARNSRSDLDMRALSSVARSCTAHRQRQPRT